MRKHKGFTLVELVVVVMILGILAAVAAPKLLGTSSSASENGLRQTLAVVRDAIERYAAEKGGALPGDAQTEADFKNDLAPYLRGSFPICPVGLKDASIAPVGGSSTVTADASPTKSWKYCYGTGQFICNSPATTKTEPGVTYDQW
jgi:prepilin-type N-terminal cleavage/methylation domain-containing protein